MNNISDKNLDELFGQLRRAEDVISQEDVQSLVQKADISTHSIRAHRSLLSPKGLTMTGFLLAGAAALVAYLTTTEPTATTQKVQQVHEIIAPQHSTAEPKQKLFVHNAPTNDVDRTPIVVKQKKENEILIYAPMTIPAEKIEKASDEQMEKLGIAKADNGDIIYSMDGENSTVRWRIPAKGWGIVLNAADKSSSTSTGIEPLVITDARGNKRIVRMKTDNELVQMHRFNNIDMTPNSSSQINSNVVEIQKGDSLSLKQKQIFMKHIISSDDNAEININDGSQVMINMGSLDSVLQEKIKEMKLKIKSVDTKLQFNIDSAINSMRTKIKFRNDTLHQMNITVDKIINKDKNVQLNSSHIIVNTENDIPQFSINKGMNFDEFMNDPEMISSGIASQIREAHTKVAAKINRLVPVLVREATSVTRNEEEGIDYDNGVIFWFEPSDALAKALDKTNPAQSVQTASAPVFGNVIAFPNPARDKTTLQFTLSEPRTVVWSIHEISGRMVTGGNSVTARSGENSLDIDVSSLASGVYMLAITTDKDERSIQRIIIER